MVGRVPKQRRGVFLGTRPSISESHSETSTRVPLCIARGIGGPGGAEVGEDRAGRDGVHADAARGVLDGELARQREAGALGGGVRGVGAEAAAALDGGDVDDGAAGRLRSERDCKGFARLSFLLVQGRTLQLQGMTLPQPLLRLQGRWSLTACRYGSAAWHVR